MATGSYHLAEAHVMRKLYKEKIKKLEEEEEAQRDTSKTSKGSVDSHVKQTGSVGCFSMFKKIHPRESNSHIHQHHKKSSVSEEAFS